MADQISLSYPTGAHLYAVLRSSGGLYASGTTPEAFTAAHWASYALAVPELAVGSGQYGVAFPALPAGLYLADVYLRAGGSPAISDVTVGDGEYQWAGAALLTPGTLLDGVTVESGVNARQALSPILAACAGVLSGAGTGTITIKGGNVATTRVLALTDNQGNRTSVTLTLPT